MRQAWFGYGLVIAVTATLTAGVVALLLNIQTRKQEAAQHYVKLVDLDESTIDPAIWGKNFPREYDGYLRTSDTACRWDRSTFMILLPNTPEISAGKVAKEIQKAFADFNFGQNFRLTVRIASVEHESGEDPMSTVSTLENKLANAAE